MTNPAPRGFLSRWILVVAAAETLGFAVPATIGVLGQDRPWLVPALLAAGALEGAVLGAAQASVLHPVLPALSRARWIVLTAVAAVVAYALGMLPSSTSEWWTTWPPALQVLALGPVGIALLLSIGAAQWLELRRRIRRAGWWIAGTALSWLAGLGVFFAVATPLWHEGQVVGWTIAIGLVAGLLMAAAMAAVTGVTMLRLLRREHPEPAQTLAS
ncbi:hypothetical protein [Microbacterium aureliae]